MGDRKLEKEVSGLLAEMDELMAGLQKLDERFCRLAGQDEGRNPEFSWSGWKILAAKEDLRTAQRALLPLQRKLIDSSPCPTDPDWGVGRNLNIVGKRLER